MLVRGLPRFRIRVWALSAAGCPRSRCGVRVDAVGVARMMNEAGVTCCAHRQYRLGGTCSGGRRGPPRAASLCEVACSKLKGRRKGPGFTSEGNTSTNASSSSTRSGCGASRPSGFSPPLPCAASGGLRFMCSHMLVGEGPQALPVALVKVFLLSSSIACFAAVMGWLGVACGAGARRGEQEAGTVSGRHSGS